MDHALLWANPTQLAVVDEVSPGLAPVCDETGERAALDALRNVGDGSTDNVIAAPDRECLRRGGAVLKTQIQVSGRDRYK